jgi:uncharacterized membrane protein YdbT with pleckstrin-like domain
MTYLQSILQPGEKVLATGKLHWIIYDGAIVSFLLGIGTLSLRSSVTHNNALVLVWAVTTVAFFGLAVVLAVRAWFDQWITEIAVTNLRVIYKRGFIRRRTWEMNMDKVESVTVDQSILGRLLDYGTVHVRGTGEGTEHLHQIASPVELRNAIVAR